MYIFDIEGNKYHEHRLYAFLVFKLGFFCVIILCFDAWAYVLHVPVAWCRVFAS